MFLEFGTRLVKSHRKCPLGGASGHAMPKRRTTSGEKSRSHHTQKVFVISTTLTFSSSNKVDVSSGSEMEASSSWKQAGVSRHSAVTEVGNHRSRGSAQVLRT